MAPAAARQIFVFDSFFIENLHVLPNGKILLSTLSSPGLLYLLDLKDGDSENATATQISDLPRFDNTTGITGIAPLGPGLFAVTGGKHIGFGFQDDSMHLYIVSVQNDTATVIDNIAVPNTASLNGLAALNDHTLLSADSIGGRILRIDTITKTTDVVLQSEALAPAGSGFIQVGINGLKIRGEFVYFTNSNLGTFGRLPIDRLGNQVGEMEILARSPDPSTQIYDDFAFDGDGNAYVAVHSNAVFKITPDGVQTTISSGDALKEPTSVAMAPDGKSIYVCTGGGFAATPRTGGQVVKIEL